MHGSEILYELENNILIRGRVNKLPAYPIYNLEKTDPSEIERTYFISKQQTRFKFIESVYES